MTSLSEQVARVKGSKLGIERELELLRKIEDASLLVQQHRAVMEQALEALEVCRSATKHCSNQPTQEAYNASHDAITSLKQALGR